ncbi:hypothetical protein [Mycobacterium sp.]|uniref:hypothetical protein n=1 Tax=Mycobacterium sp. TaxID=1785 RepID=UPI0039C8C630
MGGYAAELCARLQRPDRRSDGHLARGCRGVPRLRAPGGGAIAGRERTRPRCLGGCAGGGATSVPSTTRHCPSTIASATAWKSMMRIATGRDADDIAFLDNHNGAITLNKLVVTADVDGTLPRDAIDQLVSIG